MLVDLVWKQFSNFQDGGFPQTAFSSSVRTVQKSVECGDPGCETVDGLG